jgi:hypothetical protein
LRSRNKGKPLAKNSTTSPFTVIICTTTNPPRKLP